MYCHLSFPNNVLFENVWNVLMRNNSVVLLLTKNNIHIYSNCLNLSFWVCSRVGLPESCINYVMCIGIDLGFFTGVSLASASIFVSDSFICDICWICFPRCLPVLLFSSFLRLNTQLVFGLIHFHGGKHNEKN